MKKFLVLFSIFITIAVITADLSERRRVVAPIGEDYQTTKPQSCIAKPRCIPKKVCQPKVQCRPRPVQVPSCEELPKEKVVEPIEEDIVKITKTELPYCEYRKYCFTVVKPVPYCPEPEPEPPVKITPPPVMIKCGLLSTCCWEGLNLLPKSFWLNKDLETGRDYITIGNDGKYLSSDEEGKITIKTTVGESELFRVTKVATGIVHIMSYFGGYLTIKEDGTVDAITRTICDDNFIHIIYSKNNCSKDDINYIALRAINGNYLSIRDNECVSVDKLSAKSELFKGHMFDEKNSKCYGEEPEVEEEETKKPTTEDGDDDDDDDDDDDKITTLPTTIPKKCLDMTNKIISINCKVIIDKIRNGALTALTKKRRRNRQH